MISPLFQLFLGNLMLHGRDHSADSNFGIMDFAARINKNHAIDRAASMGTDATGAHVDGIGLGFALDAAAGL